MKKIFTLAAAVLASFSLATADDVVLYSADYTTYDVIEVGNADDNAQQDLATGERIFAKKGEKHVSIDATNGLDFHGQNAAASHCIAIPVTGINEGKITITIVDNYTSNKSKYKYAIKNGNVIDNTGLSFGETTAQAASADTQASTVVTLSPESTTECIVFIGEASSSFTKIKQIIISTPQAVVATDPVSTIEITGATEAMVGQEVSLKATPDQKADNIWWTDANGTTIGTESTLKFVPSVAGEITLTAWAENSLNVAPASQTHVITVAAAPEKCGSLIKATTQQVVTGEIGGTLVTNLAKGDAKKMDKDKHFGVRLAYGAFAVGDTLIIDITAGADLGKCMIYADKDGAELLYDEGIVYTKPDADPAIVCPTGLKKIVLTDAFAGKQSIFFYRENGNTQWNVTFSYIEVVRPCPEGTAIDNTNAEIKAVKVIRNGQLLIEKNGVLYNAKGAVVK